MRAILWVAMACLWMLGCAVDEPAPRCELGRSTACVCSSGAAGAQECGAAGAWSPCVCAALVDAGGDVAVVVDAPADAADAAAPVDAAEDRAGPDAADAPDVQSAPADAPADVPRDLGIYDAPGVCLVPGTVPCGPDPADCVYLADGRGLPARNCGACGVNCASGQMCSEGRCINPCPSGRVYCNGNLDLAIACVDPMRNAAHCGGCGVACAAPLVCEGGRCVR